MSSKAERLLVFGAAISKLGGAKVTHQGLSMRGDFYMPRTLPSRKQRIGATDMILVTIDPPSPNGGKNVEVEVSVRGHRSRFEHSSKASFDSP